MINLHTKFESSTFTRYEDMKGNAKCRNWSGLRVREYGSHNVTGNVTIRYSAYDFLSNVNRNYASILYGFRVIASYLSEVDYFNLPLLGTASSLPLVAGPLIAATHNRSPYLPGGDNVHVKLMHDS